MRAFIRVAWVLSAMGVPGLIVALAPPSLSEPNSVARSLMRTPVTLWDKGMMEARKAAGGAAERIAGRDRSSARGGARYDWHTNEIDIYLEVTGYRGDRSHENCNDMRRRFIGQLAGHVDPPQKPPEAELLGRIRAWFSHVGYRDRSHDEKLAEKLARMVFVSVILFGEVVENPFDALVYSVICRARILRYHAPSQPPRR